MAIRQRAAILIIVVVALAQALTHFGVVYSDSKDYYSLTRFIEGLRKTKPSSIALVARPLLPLLAVPLDLALGLPVAYGIVNTAFWVFSALLLYFLTKKLLDCEESAIYAALLLSTCWPMVLYGAASMTEAAGLFATLLTLLILLKLLEQRATYYRMVMLGLLCGALTLMREVVLAALASAILFTLWQRRPDLLKYFIVPWTAAILAYQAYVHFTYGLNYVTHFLKAGIEFTARRGLLTHWFDPVVISKAFILGHLPVAWLTLILGFLMEKRREPLINFYLLFIPAFTAFMIWPFHDLRIAVMCYHATLPMAGLGFKWLCEQLSSKPVFNLASSRAWAAILIIVGLIASDYVVFLDWGQLSLPWDIYLFAPSSLRV